MDQEQEDFTEKDAIRILRTLPIICNPLSREKREQLMQDMRGYMERVGLSVEELDHLNIIHVTGTKGKGSTCAFTENILRGHGFRTGFFSSPHLVQIRERIRINGQPIGKELFKKYFLQFYGRLDETKDSYEGAMPTFFGFFTLLAFRVFLEEKVDLAVIEVGIGGQYDCTNVIRRPWVCGISSLDIDHTEILGDTIEKIAWNKGGIFKPGVPAFTVKQPEDAMAVFRDRAKEIKCPLWVCPDLEDYQVDCGPLRLSLAGQHQHCNASLALQLSHTWLQRRCLPAYGTNTDALQVTSFKPSPIMLKGLANTVWPGRTQTLKHGAVTYFLDGAHTMRSMQACACWFKETSAQHERNASGPVVRVLMFNTSGGRDSAAFLKLLLPCLFDFAVFCPLIAETSTSGSTALSDLLIIEVSVEDMMNRCLEHERSWKLHNNFEKDSGTQLLIPEKKADTLVFPCILSALQWITQGRDSVLADSAKTGPPDKPTIKAKAAPLCEAAEIHVLITGGLYLVGGALKILDPASYK